MSALTGSVALTAVASLTALVLAGLFEARRDRRARLLRAWLEGRFAPGRKGDAGTPGTDTAALGVPPERPSRTGSRWPASRSIAFVTSVACVGLGLVTVARAGRAGEPKLPTAVGSVMLAVDVSRSMTARDGSPDRMEEARLAALRLLTELSGVPVGLLAFAEEPHPLLPPTRDHALVRRYLEALGPELAFTAGSDLAAAVEASLRAVQSADSLRAAGPGSVVLISDGESFSGDAKAERALEAARRHHVAVHTVTVGSEAGSPVPGLGPDAWSRASPDVLGRWAAATGGESGEGPEAVGRVLARIRGDRPLPGPVPAPEGPDRAAGEWDVAAVLAAAGLGLLLVEGVLGLTTGRLR